MIRSAAAILSGFLAASFLGLVAAILLHKGFGIRLAEHKALYWAVLAYTVLFVVAGSCVAAKFAPRRPLEHALIFGSIGFLLSVPANMASWKTAPHWYHAGYTLL